jgi:hypothetical protein
MKGIIPFLFQNIRSLADVFDVFRKSLILAV